MKERIQKLIANSGLYSRRKAEALIALGQVLVNGKTASLGQKAEITDVIEVEGKLINPQTSKVYLMFNKPIGYTCTSAKFRNEINIYSLLPKQYHSLPICGRLDKDSTGLVFLTNDGELLAKLTHPRYMHEKRYIVKIAAPKELTAHRIIQEMKNGIDIGEGDGHVQAKKIKALGKDEFEISITQGKKRQIRRMFTALGAKVECLQRIAISNLELGNLEIGKCRELSKQEIKNLNN